MEQKSIVLGCFCALMGKGLGTCSQFNHFIKRDMEILRLQNLFFRTINFLNYFGMVFVVQLVNAPFNWTEMPIQILMKTNIIRIQRFPEKTILIENEIYYMYYVTSHVFLNPNWLSGVVHRSAISSKIRDSNSLQKVVETVIG